MESAVKKRWSVAVSDLQAWTFIIFIYWTASCARYARETLLFLLLLLFFAHYGRVGGATSCVSVWNGGRTESTVSVHYLHRVLDYEEMLKKSSVASAASSVALHGLPKADHLGQRIEYKTRNSEADFSVPSLVSDCG